MRDLFRCCDDYYLAIRVPEMTAENFQAFVCVITLYVANPHHLSRGLFRVFFCSIVRSGPQRVSFFLLPSFFFCLPSLFPYSFASVHRY